MNQKQLARLIKVILTLKDDFQRNLVIKSIPKEDWPQFYKAWNAKAMKRSTKADQITAHHEAGHAVTYVLCDVEFTHATIVRKVGQSEGHVAGQRPPWMIRALNNGGMTPKIWQRAEHEVISLFAGGEAQRLFFPRSPWKKGRAGDMQIIEWMLQTLHQDADDNTVYDPVAHGRHRRHLEYRTKKFVRENRDHIEAVAKALLERKTLTADEVRRVMFPEKAVTYFVDSLGRATEIQSLSLAP